MENLKKAMIIRNGNVVGAVGDKNFSTLHVGCITPYLGTKDNVPRGYLLADGASYKTTDYPELFDIIGYTYGGSDDTFNVPNLCDGRFLEGSDTSGEYVEAGLPNITGDVRYLKSVANMDLTKEWDGAFKWITYSTGSNLPTTTTSPNTYDLEFDASKSNAIYSDDVDTVQPKSLRVLYIIKAFHTNEGVDSGVSDDVVEYVNNKVNGLISDTTSSTTSTYSSKKIDEKYGTYSFTTSDGTQWLKLTLGKEAGFTPITVTDCYGGKIEIIGKSYDGTYKSTKLVRYSYGDWTTYSATDYTTTNQGDANYKIRRLFYYPTDSCYYLEIRQYSSIKVSGAMTKPELITNLPAATSEMTLIPESNWGRIDDTSTGSTSSTWSSSKIAQQDGIKKVYTASATAYPVNFWILTNDTTGVFWFKQTFSRDDTVKVVEGYANLTNDTVIVTTNIGEVNPRISTDSTSGKKGVLIPIQMMSGDIKITEARPITAVPTQIVDR